MSQSQSSLLGTPVGDITLVGYILPPESREPAAAGGGGGDEDEEDSGSEQQEEQDQPEFLDMQEMQGGGGTRLRGHLPSRDEVSFQDIVSGRRYQVEGRFALRSPWWEVTCVARWRGKKLQVQGYPSYKLRLDPDREGWRSLVSLFLKACGVEPPELLVQFFQWLPASRELTLFNLMEVLEEFERGHEGNVGAAQCLKARVAMSTAGVQVHAASLYPLVMTYVSTLLPGHFLELLQKGKERVVPPSSCQPQQQERVVPSSSCHTQQQQQQQPASTASTQAVLGPLRAAQSGGTEQEETMMEEADVEPEDLSLLNQLEQMLEVDAWKLGFGYVMYKELSLTRCEAQLQAFMDCDLLEQMPALQRAALWAYDRLKKHCYRTGSTYMDQQQLCDRLRADVGTTEWDTWDAVQFLREQGVVMFDRQKKVGLHNFYTYETGISGCLRHLLEGEQWHIPLNAREVLHAAALERRRAKMAAAANEEHAAANEEHTAATEEEVDRIEQNGDEKMVEPQPSGLPANGAIKMEEEEEEADPERLLPPMELDEDQVRAAEMICSNAVTVISGKGGCGKTTVVSLLFRAAIEQRRAADADEVRSACAAFESDTQGWDEEGEAPRPPVSPPGCSHSHLEEGEVQGEGEQQKEEGEQKVVQGAEEVLLTAPTGRAASLLTKKTCFTAYTLHQVLWSFMMSQKEEDGSPKDWRFKSVRVLVVDEGSLVCVQLLHSVLSMLIKHAQLRKFIILGDVRQLPSIQPGNTLCDLFQSLKVCSWAIEMKTNHRAESELIVRNAGLIADMGMKKCSYRNLEFDAVVDLYGPCTMPSADKKFIHIRLPSEESDDDLQKSIKLLIDSAPGLNNDTTSQFIAFRRVDVALINELCCKHYNDHTTKNHKNKLLFQPGDKVCCTKNGYINNTEAAESSLSSSLTASDPGETQGDPTNTDKLTRGDPTNKDKTRLCNGEIFFIREDVTIEEQGRKKRRYLTLDDGDDRMIRVDFKELQRECRLQHAWARTIHTFQGSENETIVYVLGNSQAQTWKHVYTAVTRGQKRVYVVAKQEAIAAAITKRETPRTTRLSGLVKKVLDETRAGGVANVAGPPGTPRGPGPARLLSSPPGTPSTPAARPPGVPGTPSAPAARPPGLLSSPPGTPRIPEARPPAELPQSPSTQARPPGLLPSPSPRNAARSRDPSVHSSSTPSVRKNLFVWKPGKVKVEVSEDQTVMEDMVFSQAYSWSPMNSEEERFGPPREEGASGVMDDDPQLGWVRPAVSLDTPSKRLHPDRMMGTPPKQIKTEPETEKPSPLGCSSLQKLSLHTPKSSRKLYKEEPPWE